MNRSIAHEGKLPFSINVCLTDKIYVQPGCSVYYEENLIFFRKTIILRQSPQTWNVACAATNLFEASQWLNVHFKLRIFHALWKQSKHKRHLYIWKASIYYRAIVYIFNTASGRPNCAQFGIGVLGICQDFSAKRLNAEKISKQMVACSCISHFDFCNVVTVRFKSSSFITDCRQWQVV